MAHYQASLHITKCEFRDAIDARLLFLLHPKLSVAASVESLGYYPYDYGYYDDGYPDYAYGDSYYDNGDCYTVRRRVHSRTGWHVHPVQVCG